MTTEQALALLVHSRRARECWRAGTLDVPPEVAAELASLEVPAIESAAATFRRHVLERRHAGIGTLIDAFPRTVAAWRARHPNDKDLDELVAVFLDSSAATEWQETPGHTDGISLEEAFYRFATAEQLGNASGRETEWLTAAIRMLALDDEPTYRVPEAIRRRPGVAWTLDHSEPPTLYAIVGGRILIGPVTRLVADLLVGGPHGVAPEAARLVRAQLCKMGLLDSGEPSTDAEPARA